MSAPAEHAATVRLALHTLTDASFGEADDAAMHENSLNGYAALDALVALAARADELTAELRQAEEDLRGAEDSRASEAARADELERALENGDRLLSQCGRRAERAEAALRGLNDDDAVMRGVAAVRKMLRMRVGDKHAHAEAFRAALGEQPQPWALDEMSPDLAVLLADAKDALAELVKLKDGQRDDAYRAAKDAAWEAARALLARIEELEGWA